MNSYRPRTLRICFFVVFACLRVSSSFGQVSHLELPPCPTGSSIKLYGPITLDPALQKLITEAGSWKALFEKDGIKFPEGGFVIYQADTKVLVVATTADMQDMIYALVTPDS